MAADKRARERLTPKERQVARWLAQAKTNWEIGTILGISPRTVEKHVENLLRKLDVENRTAAALEIARYPSIDLIELD
jgi:DNA-binding CsgD family transcriptional regulator